MAMVLEAVASYVGGLLTQVARDEVGMLFGVSGEIDRLGGKLQDLRAFLADAERRRITDQRVQGWVIVLKDVMYDAADILELCQLKAMGRRSYADMGCCDRLLFCLRNPLFAHDVGSGIKVLNQRLDGIKERSAQFNFMKLEAYEDHGEVVSRPTTRKTAPGLDRSAVVGEKIDEDTMTLVEMLTKEEKKSTASSSSNIMIVAIVGIGGIGKTTLAQMIFNHEVIQEKFDKTIWLSVNKDFSEPELLRTAITTAGGDHCGNQELSLLQPTLTAALAGKKILLVMDDVWSDGAWNHVLRTPLVNAVSRGSRVLITTRDARVARGMKAMQPYHHVNKLGPDDAWSLLKKQVASTERDELEIETLKDTGLGIIERCDGLPLAIKAIGGLLSHKDINEVEWGKVLKNPSWSVVGMPEELNHAIYISYEDMPPPLKQCFLYHSLFPRAMGRFFMVAMWISEGFIQGSSNELEELGEEYHKELISRNLIEPDEEIIDQSCCGMHDVVRSFAHYVARDEALVFQKRQIDIDELNSQKFCRLFIQTKGSRSDEIEWSVLQKQKTLRTLILEGSIKFKHHDSLSNFSSLRTLRICDAKVATLVDSLCQLKHLRFLAFVSTDISRLPDDIGKMKFLQHIILVECEKIVKIPSSIVKLGQLRALSLEDTNISSIPRAFGGLTNLRALDEFPVHMDGVPSKEQEDWCSLEELGPLSQLRVLELKGLENVPASSLAVKAKLGAKEHLVDLTLQCTSRLGDDGSVKEDEVISGEEERRIEDVFDVLCPPSCLDYLVIDGYVGRRLPRWMMSSTSAAPLKSLRFLFLENLACCTQLPDGLGKLPNLQLLQINRAPAIKHVGPEFVHLHHNHLSREAVAFPRLRELCFMGMVEWEEWQWGEQVSWQALPVLEDLHLHGCKLRCIPPGLATHARALKVLNVCEVRYLNSLESLPSVVDLSVDDNPNLERIANLHKLQKLAIVNCPKLKVLEDLRALWSLELEDRDMGTLPGYLRDVNPRHLLLTCSLGLLSSIAMVNTGPEWDMINHIQQVKAYANDGDRSRAWYVLYRRDPYNLDTNISHSSKSRASEDDEGYDVPRRTGEEAKSVRDAMICTPSNARLQKMKRPHFISRISSSRPDHAEFHCRRFI